MDEAHPNPIKEIIRKEDLNINWIDKEVDESVKDADNNRVRFRSDDKEVEHMFGSLSEIRQ